MTRLEWALKKAEIEHLFVCGIVTNGGVASTVRDAHVRDFKVTVLSDGCAAFSPSVHQDVIFLAMAEISPLKSMACEGRANITRTQK